jgi:nucleotide-binding universal stress UspA family protein
VETTTAVGRPDTALCQAAHDAGAQMIAVGTRGLGGLPWLLLGSVAQVVVRSAEMDVLVAKGEESGEGGLQRLLVPMDFEAPALRALEMAIALAAPGAEIDVLHCVEMPPSGRALSASHAALKRLHAAITEVMNRKGSELVASCDRNDLTIRFQCEAGRAKKVVIDWAEHRGYDLVVMGSRGLHGVRRVLLGSVAEATVRHASCSVLVCRGDDGNEPPGE